MSHGLLHFEAAYESQLSIRNLFCLGTSYLASFSRTIIRLHEGTHSKPPNSQPNLAVGPLTLALGAMVYLSILRPQFGLYQNIPYCTLFAHSKTRISANTQLYSPRHRHDDQHLGSHLGISVLHPSGSNLGPKCPRTVPRADCSAGKLSPARHNRFCHLCIATARPCQAANASETKDRSTRSVFIGLHVSGIMDTRLRQQQ